MNRRPLHILLIDDNVDDLAYLRQMLLQSGRQRLVFSEAQLGTDGLRKVFKPEHGPVDCVLLDYCLPDMDALQVLTDLCQGSDMPPCPVVVITGTAADEGHNLLKAGAQDFIGKHWISSESLMRSVENAIDRYALLVDRRRAVQAMYASETLYRSLFNSIDSGYCVIQMIFNQAGKPIDSRYLEVNDAFEKQSGFQDVVGKTIRQLMPQVEQEWLDVYGTVALTGDPIHLEQLAGANQRWYDVYAFRVSDPAARQVAILFTDSTDRKNSETLLINSTAQSDAANRAKSEFLLRMSHELRSPLNIMLGFAQLIESGNPPPTPSQLKSVKQILHAGWYLLGLINEVLDLSAIESGELVVSLQDMSLNEVLSECESMITPQALEKNIDLHFPCDDQAWVVQADPIRTKQVLLNLLTNAIKYNRSPGRIDVRYKAISGGVRVSVDDTGHGLSATQIAQLFQSFNRLGKGASAEQGTGVGLVISKRLVELMHGRIGVSSQVGVGSSFWFELSAQGAPTVAGAQ